MAAISSLFRRRGDARKGEVDGNGSVYVRAALLTNDLSFRDGRVKKGAIFQTGANPTSPGSNLRR